MKTPLYFLLAGALCLPLLPAGAQTLLTDSFDSYPVGSLSQGSAWPSLIPGTAQSWQTATGGSQEIAEATLGGRDGQFYHAREHATDQIYTYSSTALPSLPGEEWSLTLDFYLDTLSPPGTTTGVFGLVGLTGGSPGTAANRVVNVMVSRRSTSPYGLQLAVTNGSNPSYIQNLELQTWYRIELTGNNATRTFSLSVTGEDFNVSLPGLSYSGSKDFDTLAIGDFIENGYVVGRDNSVYFDALQFSAIPEPSAMALFPVALLAFAGMWRRKG